MGGGGFLAINEKPMPMTYLANCLYLILFGITLSSPSLRFLSSS